MRSIEAFLEEAFGSVEPTSSRIGRVAVDPNYHTVVEEMDHDGLAGELVACIRQATIKPLT